MNSNRRLTVFILGAATLCACGDPTAFEEVPFETPNRNEEEAPNENPEESPRVAVAFVFDVAEDRTRFVVDDESGQDEGGPERGSSFMTRGYIYPPGFLRGRDGTLADGTPAHPQHVIGEWTCWGQFIGDGVVSDSRASAVSTHIYDFYEEPGYAELKTPSEHTVISEGYELTQDHGTVTRSVTGATGFARDAGGEVIQLLGGTNKTGGVNGRLYLADGFEPLIAPEDLPALPPRDFEPCEWDLFSGERCRLF